MTNKIETIQFKLMQYMKYSASRSMHTQLTHISIVHFKRLGSRHIHKEIEIS